MTDSSAAARPGRVDRDRRRRQRGIGLFLRDIVIILLAALVISVLIKTFLIRSFYIPSPSMENTLLVNDRIIVNELAPDVMPLQHGDVVVFRDPGGWLPAAPEQPSNWFADGVDAVLTFIGLSAGDSNDHLIKRVIGLPGDEVACCDDFGRMTINGVAIEEPYAVVPENGAAAPEPFDVTVPDDRLWVLGDNRYRSGDSLFHYLDSGAQSGFVPVDDVVGRAFVISWPISRWSWIDDHPSTFRGVERADADAGAAGTSAVDGDAAG